MNSFKKHLLLKNAKRKRREYKVFKKEHIYTIPLAEEVDEEIDLNDPDFINMLRMIIYLF